MFLWAQAKKTLESNLRVPCRVLALQYSGIIQVEVFVASVFDLNQAARLLMFDLATTFMPSFIFALSLDSCPNLSFGALGAFQISTEFLVSEKGQATFSWNVKNF